MMEMIEVVIHNLVNCTKHEKKKKKKRRREKREKVGEGENPSER